MNKQEIEQLTDLWERLPRADKPIVLYGMGNGADKILDECERHGICPRGVFASDDFVRHQRYRGFTVKSFDELRGELGDMIVLVAFGTQRAEVLGNIKKIAAVCETYAPDVAVVGGGLFDKSYALAHASEIQTIYERLADPLSQKTWENIIRYKISGDISCLFACESDDEPLEITADEIFLDLGAYTGDTVLDFAARAGGYEKIIALEPDRKNYEKLVCNTAHLERVTALNMAVSDRCCVRPFAMNAGRNSGVIASDARASRAKSAALCDSVDNILGGGRVTYIKADVEGEEATAIEGARETITRFHPKMKIAVYHRFNDILTIPQQVLGICGEYRLYMRHKPYVPAWDTDMFFI